MMIFLTIIQMIFVPLISPLVVGVIRKLKAKLQNRVGASIFQPYRDLWKLLNKDEVISKDASWVFRIAPIIIFAVSIVVGISIPIITSLTNNILLGDLLLIVYTLSIGTFFLALAGMDTGSAFGGFGSSREMTMAALAEGGLIFSLLTIAFVSKTTNLFTISASGMMIRGQAFLPVALAFFGFLVVMLAETARFPFDNPATHLELTMIHEAMILEYSGKKLALLEWAAANKLIIFAILGANLFFPWGISSSEGAAALLIGLIAILVKIFIFCLIIAIIESSMAKFRFFRLPDLLLISFILNVVAIGLVTIN